MPVIKAKWILVIKAETLMGVADEVNEMLNDDPTCEVSEVRVGTEGARGIFYCTVTTTEYHHDETD